jgi:hypothetical protein
MGPVLSVSETTPGHALPVEDAGHRFGRVDEHHLGRAAADVEDHRRAFAMFEQDMAAQNGQPRLPAR